MFVSLEDRWWPNRPIVCWLEMGFPNNQKWSFSRWNTCNICVGSFSIWGVQSQRGQLQYGGGYCKMYIHAHMHACTLMYMLINTHSCMHTHVCVNAYACIHLYIYILISGYENHLNQTKRFLRAKKQIYTCNWVGAYVVNRKIMRFWRKPAPFPHYFLLGKYTINLHIYTCITKKLLLS